jgi:hypothetical protein
MTPLILIFSVLVLLGCLHIHPRGPGIAADTASYQNR